MKKAIFSLVTAAVLGTAIFVGCKKESEKKQEDCAALADAISSAATAYTLEQTTEHCTALKNAYKAFLNSSCIPEDQKPQTQEALDLLEAACN